LQGDAFCIYLIFQAFRLIREASQSFPILSLIILTQRNNGLYTPYMVGVFQMRQEKYRIKRVELDAVNEKRAFAQEINVVRSWGKTCK
jgi:hypothetical protein